MDNVGFLVAPVGNDTLSLELSEDLGLGILEPRFQDISDSLQASSSGHEFVDVVDDKGQS